jgi:hypothetical protein
MTSLKDRLTDSLYSIKVDGERAFPTKAIAQEYAQSFIDLFQQEAMAVLPEKIKLDTSFYQEDYASERIGYEHGYNDAISDMESRLKERLELAPASRESKE